MGKKFKFVNTPPAPKQKDANSGDVKGDGSQQSVTLNKNKGHYEPLTKKSSIQIRIVDKGAPESGEGSGFLDRMRSQRFKR